MADKAKNPELGAVRAQYKALTGKAPSPRLDADALRSKIAEIGAAPSEQTPPADAAATGNETQAAEPNALEAAAQPKGKKAKPTDSPLGTAFVRHPEGVGCSYRGHELVPDKSGKVLVPLEAVEELRSHGFEIV